MQLMGEEYSKEEILRIPPTFSGFDSKAFETFSRLPAFEKAIFKKFNKVKVHNKKSSFDKEFLRTTITQNFTTISEVADLYKTEVRR
jgi:hypothetical protein